MKKTIITIGRQFGSGGFETAKKLSEILGIPCYDKELLSEAAKESGFCEDIFERNDEKYASAFSYVPDSYNAYHMPINHQLFIAQLKAIRKIAEKESCIFVGRCADYVLKDNADFLSVFIYAPIEKRIERIMKLHNVSEKEAKSRISRADKQRKNYYNFYTGQGWGEMSNYDLSIDSSIVGVDATAEIIAEMYKKML